MDKRQMRAFEGFAAESGAELLRIATLLTHDPHTVQVDASARDMLGRPAVKVTWTASDTTVYTVYENPADGTVLEQTYKWPADEELAPGYDLMLKVARTNTIPPDPYAS